MSSLTSSLCGNKGMGARSFLWDSAKKSFTAGLIALTISDRYASIAPVRGLSMHPTFNPRKGTSMGSLMDDCVLVDKFCLEKYKFSHGDVVVFRSPSNHKEKHIKRLIAMPGDWIRIPHSYDTVKIPEGHCWVEGDNSSSSLDSRSFGPIPLGLLQGKATYIVWPPQRVGQVEKRMPEGRLLPY
ncbi:Peptidase S26A [Macleaya cordata]|uniref:Mitochondrial inner membrane protease subunit 2 n=1 Tax=Macleaya cordata TaxID=56857 RepID=A0A200QF82_MACCD|nr:Peptidase S26A [Macleaya cordata]